MNESISFELNGQSVRIETDPTRRLLWVLRTDFELTGTKYGCGNGACGACTVLVDGVATRSCLATVGDARNRKVITIEGLAQDGKLHPLQQAFIDHDALQCGFCTPGMILNAYGLLLANPNPTQADVIEGMDDNLCRCGAHPRIVSAVLAAAETMKGGQP